MDIFGKPKARTKFQDELDSKLKERKEKGMSFGLSDEEDDALDSDDDLLAAFNQTKQRPSVVERRERLDEKPVQAAPAAPVKPQPRSSLANNKGKIKPKSALDALLDEDEEDGLDMMKTQKKPWKPPQFGEFKHEADSNNNQSERPSPNQRKSLLKSGRGGDDSRIKPAQRSILEEEDEELMSAYNQTLNQRKSPEQSRESPFIRQTPSPGTNQSGRTTPKSELQSRATPKSELTGKGSSKSELTGRPNPKNEKSSRLTPRSSLEGRENFKSNLDGQRTPRDQKNKSPFARDEGEQMRNRLEDSRKSPALMEDPFGTKSPKPAAKGRSMLDDIFGRGGNDSEANSLFGSGQSTIRENKKHEQEDSIFGRKSPSVKSGKLDDIFGKKSGAHMEPQESQRKKTESPHEDMFGRKSPAAGREKVASPAARKGSFMSSLLDDKPEERDMSDEGEISRKPAVRKGSYLNNLLGDESDKPKENRRTSFMDSLLADDEQKPAERASRSGVRRERSDVEERESSICRDVDKDPQMIEQAEKEIQEKKAKRAGKPQTESQKHSNLIEDVADAQNKTMTYIEPQSTLKTNPQKTSSTSVIKPKPRKTESPADSTMTFESAADIRNYIYKEWSEKTKSASRKKVAEKKRREKELEDLKRKEEQDKRLDSEATFRTWKEQKDERIRQKLREQKKLEKEKLEKEKEEQEKKVGADICFKKWKESKDEHIKEKVEEKKDKKLETLKQKRGEKERKQKESEGAYSGWKKRKDSELKKTFRQTKLLETMQGTEEQREKRRREREAEKLYEEWLIKKQAAQKRREKRDERIRRSIYDDEPRPAWSPANRTIPQGR